MLKFAILGDLIQTPEFTIDDALLQILQQSDFNIANFEAPFIGPEFRPANGKSGLCQKLPDAALLKRLNIKIVSLANNHIGDFGSEGFRNTKKILDENGILYFGAGEGLTEAERPAVLNCKGLSVSCRGAMSRYLTRFHAETGAFGSADIRADRMIENLKKDTADIKIVYNHWNQEYEDYPEPIYKEDAEKIIQYAHVIAGSHSHCMQGIGDSSGRLIFYGLGNFSLPNTEYFACRVSPYRPKCYHSFFPVISFANGQIDYRLYPYVIGPDGFALSLPSEEETAKILRRIEEISVPLGLSSSAYRRYYLRNRDRKMRKPLTRSHRRNSMNLRCYRLKYGIVHGLESGTGAVLGKMGLRRFVRSALRPLIDKIQKAK